MISISYNICSFWSIDGTIFSLGMREVYRLFMSSIKNYFIALRNISKWMD
ncbi:hypothetical protein IFVP408_C2120321 [Vibrio parahaemolyticus]